MARTLRRECPKVRAMARIDSPSRCARRILAKSSSVSILASVPQVPWATGPIGTDAAGVGPFYLPIPGQGVGPFCPPITTTEIAGVGLLGRHAAHLGFEHRQGTQARAD